MQIKRVATAAIVSTFVGVTGANCETVVVEGKAGVNNRGNTRSTDESPVIKYKKGNEVVTDTVGSAVELDQDEATDEDTVVEDGDESVDPVDEEGEVAEVVEDEPVE